MQPFDEDLSMPLGAVNDDSDSSAADEPGVYDTSGNPATDETLFGDVDGRKTSVGAFKDYVTENVYTKEETDDAIDRLAAYYITSNAQGDAFASYAALSAATLFYSGGEVRTPTRNDYAVVLADETHGGAEWRYIYAVADGETVGQWEAQYPVQAEDPNKLNQTAAAPAFSASSTYSVNDYVTYQGNLYRFTAAHPAGAWTGLDVEIVNMTTPDATLNVTGGGALQVVAADGSVLWQQGYDLKTTASLTLSNESVNYYEFASGTATGTVTLVLPAQTSGKVADFVLDVKNSSENEQNLSLGAALDSAMSVVIPEDEDLAEWFTIEAGEMSEFYFTLTAFAVNGLPTYRVVKMVLANGGAQS